MEALLRSVSEQPMAAAAAKAAVMPGTIRRRRPLGERGHLFRGAAKDERVAALEADDGAMRGGRVDHERVDFVLRDGFCAAALADVDNFRAGRGEIENCLRDKVVVQDDVGGLDEAQGFDGEQVGIAGACADEVDRACGASRRFAGRAASQRPIWREGQVADAQSGRWAS